MRARDREREKTYAEIDKLEKAKVDKFEVILNEKLPEVFSIVKETARRFSENESIVVTATELDRKLATTHDFVEINGDKAAITTTGWQEVPKSLGTWCTCDAADWWSGNFIAARLPKWQRVKVRPLWLRPVFPECPYG